ncbi:substrate-binding periplasmic protein [Vibrio pectenicida]|uniref:Transporter substrate-binding domain-containing protein n=1 Tax=Vibrio pectenicida TaxID=62763 RepID=A0A427U0W5_9VIBR|nr:transporter substrate-binding domain-containing protein [Vibrio pectenicida]RSD30295.1 transporter substrate-binding domain-containing protein [Vibrio pectenicida]
MKTDSLTPILFKIILFTVSMVWTCIANGNEDVVRVAIGEGHKSIAKVPSNRNNVEAYLSQIYAGAKIDVEFIYLPNERAIQSVISGQYDALGLRIDGLEKEDNIIKVDVPLGSFDVYFLSRGDRFINNLDEAKNETVIALHGARYVEALKHYKKLHLIYSEEQAALMLTKGRADLWLAPIPSYQLIKDTYPNIKISSPIVSKENVYHYIHSSQTHLLERLENSAKRFVASRKALANAKQLEKP